MQFGELTLPDRAPGSRPAIVLIHGGSWRGGYSFQVMRPFARALARCGVAVWNIEYRRVGRLGGGGGWPATFEDVAAAVDFLNGRPEVDTAHVVSCGHSAGGHLALWAAARHRLPGGAPGARGDQTLEGAVALAPVSDLERLGDFGLGSAAVDRLLGGNIHELPERFRLASPVAQLPFGIPQLLIHGSEDRTIPAAMSEAYVARTRAAGDEANLLALPGLGHRQLIEPWHHVARHVADFAETLFA